MGLSIDIYINKFLKSLVLFYLWNQDYKINVVNKGIIYRYIL